ncbi:MAG: hypothetical protein WA030_04150 [Candidatus Microsaccharimonas sp.]
MNDNEELKARSVELAERAFRLRDKAKDGNTQEKLHAAGNELIMIDNRRRFYDSQRELEQGDTWSEDQRTLAHEINVADRNMRGTIIISFESSLEYLNQWFQSVSDNPPEGVTELIENLVEELQIIKTSGSDNRRKEAINFIITFIEEVLQYSHKDEDIKNEMTDPTVLMLRDIRDSLLVHRELMFDENELVTRYKSEGQRIERLGLARHQLAELYKSAG